MTFPFSKAFSLSAIAAVSTMGVTIAQPAEAITPIKSPDSLYLTPNSGYTDPVGYTTRLLNFNDLLPGEFVSTQYNNSPDTNPDKVTINDISRLNNGNVTIGPSNISNPPNRYFQFATPNGQNDSRLEFVFGNSSIAYFGVRLLNLGNDATIQFFNGEAAVPDGLFTFANISPNTLGNYYNFLIPNLSTTVNRVVIAGRSVQLDDVAYRVPTPALLPGLVGMGVAALRKRKSEEEQEA